MTQIGHCNVLCLCRRTLLFLLPLPFIVKAFFFSPERWLSRRRNKNRKWVKWAHASEWDWAPPNYGIQRAGVASCQRCQMHKKERQAWTHHPTQPGCIFNKKKWHKNNIFAVKFDLLFNVRIKTFFKIMPQAIFLKAFRTNDLGKKKIFIYPSNHPTIHPLIVAMCPLNTLTLAKVFDQSIIAGECRGNH